MIPELSAGFILPGSPDAVRDHCGRCCQAVFDGEYSYPRDETEDVHTIVDVGCNLGAFLRWATIVWWPGRIVSAVAYDPNFRALGLAIYNVNALSVDWHRAAVTTAAPPVYFREQDNWGGSGTWRETSGVEVPVVHPRDLPASDVLKVDAEGVELEVLSEYRHWDTLRVLLFEVHLEEHFAPIERLCLDHGLVGAFPGVTPAGGQKPGSGVEVWRRI